MRFRQAIFDRLAQLDKEQGRRVSGSELARRIGVSQQTFSKWQAGDALPDESRIARVAKEIPEIYEIMGITRSCGTGDPDLDFIISRWKELSEDIRRKLVELAKRDKT